KKIHTGPVRLFPDGTDAFDFLVGGGETPFIILSDINMPKMSGPELCNKIQNNESLKQQYIPFIFFTSSTTKNAITDAYLAAADGFFIKPNTFQELEEVVFKIHSYWSECQSPADY